MFVVVSQVQLATLATQIGQAVAVAAAAAAAVVAAPPAFIINQRQTLPLSHSLSYCLCLPLQNEAHEGIKNKDIKFKTINDER